MMTKKPDDAGGKGKKDFLEELAGDDPEKLVELEKWKQKKAKAKAEEQEPPSVLLEIEEGYPFTHLDQARLFVDRFEGRVKFVGAKGGLSDMWLFFDGVRWVQDLKCRIWNEIIRILRPQVAALKELLAAAASKEEAKKFEAAIRWCCDRSNIVSIATLAQALPGVGATVVEFDTDPWLLGTPGGVVDLKTGKLRPAAPADMITKITAVAPAEKGTEPKRWKQFLEEIFRKPDGTPDYDLIAYMQRMAGYALLGVKPEHKIIFAWGQGGNGKSVFFNTIAEIMDAYATRTRAETFMAKHFEETIPVDTAALHGARLVISSELPPGKMWDEAKLKDFSGGDKVRARFMRANTFEFKPNCLLCFQGNTKPSLKRIDIAIKRRFDLVPFLQNIPKDKQDVDLPEKLKEEWPAILRWMIQGALLWQVKNSLLTPTVVAEASQDYLDEEDELGQWLAECCKRGASFDDYSKDLYESWVAWCEPRKLFPGTDTAFGKRLSELNFIGSKDGTGKRKRRGLRLKTWAEKKAEADAEALAKKTPPF